MAMAGATNVRTLYVLRFFVGLMESSAFPGILTLLGNWYIPQELGKRGAIFVASGAVSQMFSGYLQAGLYSGMDHKHGLRAWQWLFIFDGIIGIPVALYGFWAVPDSPGDTRARWLTPRDKEIAVARMERVGREPPKRLTWRVMKDVFTSWPVYLFTIANACQVLGNRIYIYFPVYLKATGRYSVEEVNVIPSAGFGFQCIMTLSYAWISDAIQKRVPAIYMAVIVATTGCIILSIYPENNHTAMLAGWILTYGQAGASAMMIVWLNELLSFSREQRLVAIGFVEMWGFVTVAWVILFAYPSWEAPHFRYGYELATTFFVVEGLAITAAWLCEKRFPLRPSMPRG